MFGSQGAEKTPPPQPGQTGMTLQTAFQTFAKQRGQIKPNELAARLAKVILEFGVRSGASDVHFDPLKDQAHVRFRVDGILYDQLKFSTSDFPVPAVLRVMADFSPTAGTMYHPEDGRFAMQIDGREVQFRASAFPTVNGSKLVLRVLDMGQNTLNLDHLGFSPKVLAELKTLIQSPNGIMIVAGMTGSGKTTTLCSILKTLAQPGVNTMTLEDPVEYQIPRVAHAQVDVRKGFTFAMGLRALLRQDPNIVMVGEIRDQETAEIALRAAMTGHIIFSTIHTTTTTSVINRLIGMGIEPYMITSALIGTLAQRLVRVICAACAQKSPLNAGVLNNLLQKVDEKQKQAVQAVAARQGAQYLKAKGCPACKNTGYRGRVGLYELLTINDQIRSLVKKDLDVIALRQAAINSGMQSLLMDGVSKAWAGWTTMEEVARVVGQ